MLKNKKINLNKFLKLVKKKIIIIIKKDLL